MTEINISKLEVFALRSIVDERKRIIAALDAKQKEILAELCDTYDIGSDEKLSFDYATGVLSIVDPPAAAAEPKLVK